MHIDTTVIIKAALLFLFLLATTFIILFNLLYHSRALRATTSIGLHIPKQLNFLKYVSIYLALFTGLMLLVLFLFNYPW